MRRPTARQKSSVPGIQSGFLFFKSILLADRWPQKYLASSTHSIEDERLMELELAHHAINVLVKLVESTIAKP